MVAEYKNRYGDIMVFTDNNDGTVDMEGAQYFRVGYGDDNKTINMVDPSGGPYITKGSNLNLFFEDGVDRIVELIDFEKGKIIFKIK